MSEAKPTETQETPRPKKRAPSTPSGEPEEVSTEAEAGLYSEARTIKEQACEAKPLQETENLLPDAPDSPPEKGRD